MEAVVNHSGVTFSITEVFSTSPEVLFDAWLDSESHSSMTGSKSQVSNREGEDFSAWDGYIKGKNLELQRPFRILQTWRTADFVDSEPDSILEITFSMVEDRTKVTIQHSELPEHGTQYQQGWVEAYFNPMKNYFPDK